MTLKQILAYVQRNNKNINPTIMAEFIKSYNKAVSEFYTDRKLTKVSDYLYRIDYKSSDYKAGAEYSKSYKNKNGSGKCSSIRVGSFYGRNLDWYYDNKCSIIVNMEAGHDHYASVGLVGVKDLITKEFCEKGTWDEIYQALPCFLVDGINEFGVTANINVVPFDKGFTYGTDTSKPDLSLDMVVRYILDKCKTAREGVELLKQYNCISASAPPINEELHIEIGDPTSTYVVEFINNKIKVFSDQIDEFEDFIANTPIMTNFNLDGFDGTRESLTDFGQGFERYNILLQGAGHVQTIEDMRGLMNSVKYSLTFSEDEMPLWLSEYVGDHRQIGYDKILTNKSPAEDFVEIMEFMRQKWEERDRDNPFVWQTVHCSVYDIDNKILTVASQEKADVEIAYQFNENTHKFEIMEEEENDEE